MNNDFEIFEQGKRIMLVKGPSYDVMARWVSKIASSTGARTDCCRSGDHTEVWVLGDAGTRRRVQEFCIQSMDALIDAHITAEVESNRMSKRSDVEYLPLDID